MRPSLVRTALAMLVFVLLKNPVFGQLRQVYLDPDSTNSVEKISFYAPNEGYVAFDNWIGFTSDSGRSFTKKYIQIGNVNYGPYSNINYTFGYEINGVKAFDSNNLIVYGDYGLVPAILSSSDGGNTFTLVFYSQFNALQLRSGIMDMVFPQNDGNGYAVDADRILKTTDKGLTWTVLTSAYAGSYFNHIEAVDDNNLIVMSTADNDYTDYPANLMLKTSDGGATWSKLTLPSAPQSILAYGCFLDANTGWLNMTNGCFYGTTDGGATWTQLNNAVANPFLCSKMRFIDANNGFALVPSFEVYKTTNGGITWERLPRDNSFTYLNWTNTDLQYLSPNQLWAGGAHGFLEMSTNGGGVPVPTPYFLIDTTGVFFTNSVTLTNFSRSGCQYQWIVNHQPVSTSYNASYIHNVTRNLDSVQLVVSNGLISDTLTKLQYFFVPVFPQLSTFYPPTGSTGTFITIKGSGFAGVTGASFGGTPASSFAISGDTMVTAIVAAGATGNVTLMDLHGSYSLAGFTYFPPQAGPPPVISSVNPATASAGGTITISGSGFSADPTQTSVYFGSVPASVVSVTGGSIVCTVPTGATLGTITVLNRANGLTGTSPLPFGIPFADSAVNFTRNSFTPGFTKDYGEQTVPSTLQVKDLDGDGKPDLLAVLGDSLAAFRNISANGHIRFAPQVNFGGTQYPSEGKNAADDLDGDGLPDYVAVTNDNYVIAYHNTSTPGNVSFDKGFRVPATPLPNNQTLAVVAADFDNDGHDDLAIATFAGLGPGFISVARNTSSPGYVSFGPTQIFAGNGQPAALAAGDLDGDGLRDIVSLNWGNSLAPSAIACYLNTSIKGAISFATPVQIDLPSNGLNGISVAIADFDMDGKPDVEVSDGIYLYVFRNVSTPGNLSFQPALQVSLFNNGDGASLANFTGSYRPDVMEGAAELRDFMWFKNLSSPGAVHIDSVMYYSSLVEIPFQASGAGDFDNDGKPDLAVTYISNNDAQIVVLHNTVSVPVPSPMCTTGPWVKELVADIPGKTHHWQVNTGSGFTNLADNANISGSATDTLTFIQLPLSWQGYLYRCIVDSFYSSTFVVQLDTVINPGVAITVSDSVICFGSSVTFTAADTSDNTNYNFQFEVNGKGVNASYPINTLTANTFQDGDQVRVILLYSDACQNVHYDTSRVITIHTNETPDSVTISTAQTTVCEGAPVSFTAVPVNPGSNPSYNWLINGVAQGVNMPTLTPSGLADGSRVQVQLNSSAACPYPATASSNMITMTVQDSAVLSVAIAVSANNVCKGASVTFTATPAGDGPVSTYQWLVNGVTNGQGANTFTSDTFNNSDRVQCILSSTALCRTQNVVSSNIVVMAVQDSVVPAVSVSASDTLICPGTVVTFYATPVNGGQAPAYQWLQDGVTVADNSSTYATGSLAGGDSVSVKLVSSATCATQDPVTSAAVAIALRTPPSITISGDTLTAPNTPVLISSTVMNGGDQPVYQWQDSTAAHSWEIVTGSDQTISFTPTASGDRIRCVVTDAAGCFATSNTIVFTLTKIAAGTVFYPNPAYTYLYIGNANASDPIVALTVTDMFGNQNQALYNLNGQDPIKVDLASLVNGVYFVNLIHASGKSNHFSFVKL